MFISKDTVKFLEERDHYIVRNAKTADDLSDHDLKMIAKEAGVSIDKVLDDAKAYDIDLRHHHFDQGHHQNM